MIFNLKCLLIGRDYGFNSGLKGIRLYTIWIVGEKIEKVEYNIDKRCRMSINKIY